MVTDGQVLELWRWLRQGLSLAASARMARMDEKTARKYREDPRLPSARKTPRNYRTRVDPFAGVWAEIEARLEAEPRLQAKTLFEWLQARFPGEFPNSTRRTFERRVARWRSLSGPNQPVMFEQVHHPGRVAASDFTAMNELGVKIAGSRFDHTLFHCVLTYSNVESISLCFSESFEALSAGIQKAFWEFGGVPKKHRTDSLGAAVKNHSDRKTHTERYQALMDYYGSQPERTNVRCANENGDVESLHGHLKNRIDQALLLRGSRDFASREEYVSFLEELIAKANNHRRALFEREQEHLGRLPDHRLDTDEVLQGLRVRKSSTIHVRKNVYSVPSRLIGRTVDVKIGAEWIEVTHQGVYIQRMPRLLGTGGASIHYRHVIDSLVRKPGAFENYKYREEMFPTTHFRVAYDLLLEKHSPKVADKSYLKLLELAAHESQGAVQDVLRMKIQAGECLDVEEIRSLVLKAWEIPPATDVEVEPPLLSEFDCLLDHPDMESPFDDHDQNIQVPEEIPGEEASRDEPISLNEAEGSGVDGAADRTTPRTSPAEFSGPLPERGPAGGDGEPQPSGIPFGTDDARMRSEAGGADQTPVDAFQAAVGQDVGVVRLEPAAVGGDETDGNASRRHVPGPPGEPVGFWSTGLWKKSRLVRALGAVDTEGPQPVVYNVRPAGSTTADRQARLAVGESDQATGPFRGPHHRRFGLCPAKPGGNGSALHLIGRALRTRQRAVDEQPGVQQVGSNLQGCDDDRGSDRPLGPPQRDPGTQRAQLPRGNRQANQIPRMNRFVQFLTDFVSRNSNCR